MFLRGVLIVSVLILLAVVFLALGGGTIAALFLVPDDAGTEGLWLAPLCGLGLIILIGLPLLLLAGCAFGRHHAWKPGSAEGNEDHPFGAARMWWQHRRPHGAVPPWCYYREEMAGKPAEPAKEEPR